MRAFVRAIACGVVLGSLVASSRASAAEGDVEAPRETTWYGWQGLIADGASVAIASVGIGGLVATRSGDTTVFDALLVLGSVGYLVGTPAVHAAHANALGAGLSIATRLAAPTIDFVIVLASMGSSVGLGVAGPFILSAILLIPPHIDAAVLSYDRRPARAPSRGVSIVPTLEPRKDGATFGVAGAF